VVHDRCPVGRAGIRCGGVASGNLRLQPVRTGWPLSACCPGDWRHFIEDGLTQDVITCPVQLDEPTWHSIGDVDPALADRTRQRLWRELEGDDITGAGSHFPELKFGRVLRGSGKRWWT